MTSVKMAMLGTNLTKEVLPTYNPFQCNYF
jgi:hypothetical protein